MMIVCTWISLFCFAKEAQVEAVAEGNADLPCDLKSSDPDDRVVLVIWFNNSGTAIYSYDNRSKWGANVHWFDNSTFGGEKFFFRTTDSPAYLTITNVTDNDSGRYRCRVDFARTQTRNQWVNLTVIIPPHQVMILNDRGDPIKNYILGPYLEGQSINITCLVTGGRPQPRVTWWLNNITLLDDSYEWVSDRRVQNVLSLENLERKHLDRVYTCQAYNHKLTQPINSTVRIDIKLAPLSVEIVGDNKPLSEGKLHEITCKVIGAHPKPLITWFVGEDQQLNAGTNQSGNGNTTTSSLGFVPRIEDTNKTLTCRAETQGLANNVLSDSWTLNIYHKPKVLLTLGSTLNASALHEGVDAYFDCHITANPKEYKVGWRHNNVTMVPSPHSGIVISDHSLILRRVNRSSSGEYECVAYNQEGEGISNPVILDIKFRPVCRPAQTERWHVARGEVINITCELEANPDEVYFYWRLNHSADSHDFSRDKHVDERARSFLQYAPNSDRDYGTLECWGRNSQGRQEKPCSFTVITAGKPEAPFNCTLLNQSTSSLTIGCNNGVEINRREPGGHNPESYQIIVMDGKDGYIVRNFTSKPSIFVVDRLEPNRAYRVDIHAVNVHGQSEPCTVHDAFTLKGAERHTGGSPASMALTPLLGAVGGAFSALVLAALLIVLAIRARTRRAVLAAASRDAGKTAAAVTATASNEENDKEEDDNNPDLIPGKGDVDVVDPDEKAFEYLSDRRLYPRRSIGHQWGYHPPPVWGNTPAMPAMSTMPDNTTVTYAALDGTLPRASLRVSHPMTSPALTAGPTSPMTSSSSTVPSVAGVLSGGLNGGLSGGVSGGLSGGVGPGSLATLRRTRPLGDTTAYTPISCMPDQVRQSMSTPPILSPVIQQIGGGLSVVGTLGVGPPPSVTATRF